MEESGFGATREVGRVGRAAVVDVGAVEEGETAAEEKAGGMRSEARKDWTRAMAREAFVFW